MSQSLIDRDGASTSRESTLPLAWSEYGSVFASGVNDGSI